MLACNWITLGPVKHEKVARLGRISNVFRILGARSAEKSVDIKVKECFDPSIIL